MSFFDFYKVRFPDINTRRLVGEQMELFALRIEDIKQKINGVKAIKKEIINQLFGSV